MTLKVIFPRDIAEYLMAVGEELDVLVDNTEIIKLDYPNTKIEGILSEDSVSMIDLKKGRTITFNKKGRKYIALVFDHMIDR